GSLEPGKLADLVVLSADIMTCPVDKILDLTVIMTMVNGKVVFQHKEFLISHPKSKIYNWTVRSCAVQFKISDLRLGFVQFQNLIGGLHASNKTRGYGPIL